MEGEEANTSISSSSSSRLCLKQIQTPPLRLWRKFLIAQGEGARFQGERGTLIGRVDSARTQDSVVLYFKV